MPTPPKKSSPAKIPPKPRRKAGASGGGGFFSFQAPINFLTVLGAGLLLIGWLSSKPSGPKGPTTTEQEIVEGKVKPGPVEVLNPVRKIDFKVYRINTEHGWFFVFEKPDKSFPKLFTEDKNLTYKEKRGYEVWMQSSFSPCLWYAAEGLEYPAVTRLNGVYRKESAEGDVGMVTSSFNEGKKCEDIHIVMGNSREGMASGILWVWLGGFLLVGGLLGNWAKRNL